MEHRSMVYPNICRDCERLPAAEATQAELAKKRKAATGADSAESCQVRVERFRIAELEQHRN